MTRPPTVPSRCRVRTHGRFPVASLFRAFVWIAVLMAWAPAARSTTKDRPGSAPVAGFRVVRAYPHDRTSFTQGLAYVDGVVYEGIGLVGKSAIRKVDLETGKALQHHAVEERYFGEGITVWRDRIVQLTYKDEVGFVYDRKTLREVGRFRYAGEGWGLANDGTSLIMSDGSSVLRFLDPRTFAEIRRLSVHDAGKPVHRLNELEIVRGEIWANVWQSHRIARISAKTGEVIGWVDLSGLLDPADAPGTDVLNGIAYDRIRDRVFVTGKLWPKLFEIEIATAPR